MLLKLILIRKYDLLMNHHIFLIIVNIKHKLSW